MEATTTQLYISLLEKTNQQLSLWTNPYAVMIGVLAILFTVLTIVAVFIILRQGKEYKEYYQKAVDEYKHVLTQEIKIISENAKKGTQSLIDNGNIEIERLKTIKEPTQIHIDKIKQIEDDVKRLENRKDYFASELGMQAGMNLSDSIKLVTPTHLYGFQPKDSLLRIKNDFPISDRHLYFDTCECGNLLTSLGSYCSICGKKIK